MTAALRGLGLPARYVSGYLRTLPPPGQEKLQGSDASHAWVQVWAGPGAGWIDLDPTNNRPADRDHITLGWGRDYDDIAPLRGVITGGGSQTVYVAVDVEEMPDEERPDTARAGSEVGL
jgi:transglutaminase-like putative cysteine protease